MAQDADSSSYKFEIPSTKSFMINHHKFFPKICRTCEVKDNLELIYIDSNKLNPQELSIYDKLYICCPELDLRINPKATFCISCFKTINNIYEFNCKLHEHFAFTLPYMPNIHLFEKYSCKDEIKTEGVDLPDIERHHSSNHIQIQDIAKPFKHFKYNFKSNKYIHINKRLFKCPVCDHTSTKKSNLKNHLRVHTGDKPFKCSICDYRSTLKSNLEIHLRIHTKEKPFKCSMCDYKCSTKSNLNLHFSIHVGKKPFKCSVCDYSSSRKSSLKRHLYIHIEERSFKGNV